MTLVEINRRLGATNPAYTAKFVRAEDESVDDEIAILLAGQPTRWSIQIGDMGDYAVNEYGFEEGEIAWVKCHGFTRSLPKIIDCLVAVIGTDAEVTPITPTRSLCDSTGAGDLPFPPNIAHRRGSFSAVKPQAGAVLV